MMSRLTSRADRGGPFVFVAVTGLLSSLPACAEPDYRAADLQLDIDAAIPVGAELIHVCVDGVGMLDQGAGNGRVAFAAIPPSGSYGVTVEVRDADGASMGVAGPATLSEDVPWVLVAFDPAAPGGCVTGGDPVLEGEDSWLLGVRFDESSTPWDLD